MLGVVGKRRRRRRTGLPRCRGQIELLESRTVLSASIGPIPANVEFGASLSWEGAFAQAARGPGPLPTAIVAPHAGVSPPLLALHGARDELGRIDRPTEPPVSVLVRISPPPIPFRIASLMQVREVVTIVPTGQFHLVNSVEGSPPPPGPVAAVIVVNGPHDQQLLHAPNATHSLGDLAGPFANLLAIPRTTTQAASSSAATLAGARDAAFQARSFEPLLLSADVAESFTDHDDLDDFWSCSDEAREESAERIELDLHDDIADSLDLLDRERIAVEQVVSKLHDLQIPQEEAEHDASQDAEKPSATTEHGPTDSLRTTDAQTVQDTPIGPEEGGMVLLQPSGDPNLSAYDLTANSVRMNENAAAAPLRVEASLGIHQAFDIGGDEQWSRAKKDVPAAPRAAAPPAVSAEDAVGKTSDQPS